MTASDFVYTEERLRYEAKFGSGAQLHLMGKLHNIDWEVVNRADEAPGIPQHLASIELDDHDLSVLAKHSSK